MYKNKHKCTSNAVSIQDLCSTNSYES